VKKSWLFWKK